MRSIIFLGLLLSTSFAFGATFEGGRTIETDQCQFGVRTVSASQTPAEDLRLMGYKVLKVERGQVFFCSSEKTIPQVPVCDLSVNQNGSLEFEKELRPLPSASEKNSSELEFRMLFVAHAAGQDIVIDSSKEFADVIVTITDSRTKALKSSVEGGLDPYYNLKNPKPFKYFLAIGDRSISISCHYRDKQ